MLLLHRPECLPRSKVRSVGLSLKSFARLVIAKYAVPYPLVVITHRANHARDMFCTFHLDYSAS